MEEESGINVMDEGHIIRNGIKLALGKMWKAVWGLILSNPLVSIVVVVIFLVAVILFCTWGKSDSELQREADKAADKSIGLQAESNVKQEQVEKDKVEVKTAEKEAVNARKERERSNKKDSKEFDSKEAEDRYCSRWPDDSTCEEWRKRNGR